MPGNQGQALLWKSAPCWCVSSPWALWVLGGGTGIIKRKFYHDTENNIRETYVVSVLCFGLSHLEAAREPARVNIPSEYFKLQSSLVIITHR